MFTIAPLRSASSESFVSTEGAVGVGVTGVGFEGDVGVMGGGVGSGSGLNGTEGVVGSTGPTGFAGAGFVVVARGVELALFIISPMTVSNGEGVAPTPGLCTTTSWEVVAVGTATGPRNSW